MNLCIPGASFLPFSDGLRAVFLKWQAGHCDIITHNAACWGDLPKPPNRMVNHAAARFFKTLMAPFRCRKGTEVMIIEHGYDSFPVLLVRYPVAAFVLCWPKR